METTEKGISKKYSLEIQDINNKIRQLEIGRIYEFSRAQMDGYLATNISQLKKMIEDLIWKIEYGLDSRTDEISEVFAKIKTNNK